MDGRTGRIPSLLLAAATSIALTAGCVPMPDSGEMQEQVRVAASEHAAAVAGRNLPPGLHEGNARILRHVVDAGRERLWVLASDGVTLYSLRTRKRIAQVSLPGWHWAGEPFGCAPGLALGRRGEAIVTSDVRPLLWRIDANTLGVTQHELALDADADKDVGFSGLAYSGWHGGFFAVSHSHGTLWRIESTLGRAEKVPLSAPVQKACGLSVEPRALEPRASLEVDLCIAANDERRLVRLAPDQRSAQATTVPCRG